MMELRLLGPIEVLAVGRSLELGRPQQCLVLAALAVDAGRPVPVDTLVDRVWSDAPPPHARRTLQTHIARIRRLLAQAGTPEAPVRLVRRPGGYVLEVGQDDVDLHRFRRLVVRAGAAADAERVSLLREALALWRGEPLAGLPGQWVERMRDGWRQHRLDAAMAWAQAEIQMGNPGAVIGPLSDLIRDWPLVEPLVAALMRALCAAGRAAEALDCYAAARQRLADQLGTDPGPELRRLHQSTLRGELDQATPAPVPTAVAVPAQLPVDVRGFTGRRAELARLDELLAGVGEQPTQALIVALTGTAGVGKTALSVRWAHRVAHRYPDGQLYMNLRGFDPGGPAVSPAEVVRCFLEALGVPRQRIPASPEAQIGLYRTLLAGRRMLVVLDNARDAVQVRPLLPGTPGCLVIVTSRSELCGLVVTEGAHPLTLDLLTSEEARQLLASRLGRERVAAEPGAVDQLVAWCVRLPLALMILAARAAARPGIALSALAAESADADDRLDTFEGDDAATDIRAVFSWSYRTLDADAARLFRLLGLHPGPDITAAAAASLAGVPVRQARRSLGRLARAHLVTEHLGDRYGLHDLLRAFARELVCHLDRAAARDAAIHRMLDHYLRSAYAASQRLYPYRDPIILPDPALAISPEHFADRHAALSWFTAEDAVLRAAIAQRSGGDFDTHTWQLAWTMAEFCYQRGHWDGWVAVQRMALPAAHRLGSRTALARTHRGLARAYAALGRCDDARTHYQRALDLFAGIGDRAGQARSLLGLAWVSAREDDNRAAVDHAGTALELFRSTGQTHGTACALNALGWYHAQLGDLRPALAYCQQALTLQQRIADGPGQAGTWDSLGYIHHHLDDFARAATCYGRAVDFARDTGDHTLEADALVHLGDAHQGAGDREAARTAWKQALQVLERLDHPDAVLVRRRLNGLSRTRTAGGLSAAAHSLGE